MVMTLKFRMMKNAILLFLIFGLFACNSDENIGFDVPVEFRKDLSFRPVPGGAVMNYYLPRNPEVAGIRVRYNDVRGMEMVLSGTYLSDSLLLLGFNEKRENVPALVTFFNDRGEESSPMEFTFDTEDSAPVSFFDNLKVNSFCGGFSMMYSSPEVVSGLVHVFYLGTNPLTQRPDTILVMTSPIVEGGDTLNFVLKQTSENNTVVVRTEDYRGYRVKQQIFEGLPALYMDTLKYGDFDFKFTGKIIEREEYALGEKYLFDGDRKGEVFYRNKNTNAKYKYATFAAGPGAFGERFIIDLRKEKVPAAVRLYAYLNYYTVWPTTSGSAPALLKELWNGAYRTRLPCKVALYGTNENPETVNLSSCVRLFRLDYNPNSWESSWAKFTDDMNYGFVDGGKIISTIEDIAATDPVCLDMRCNYTGDSYRYLIFVIEDTFNYPRWGVLREENPLEYVTFNELEVSVKAE